jgi:hypothetical protein
VHDARDSTKKVDWLEIAPTRLFLSVFVAFEKNSEMICWKFKIFKLKIVYRFEDFQYLPLKLYLVLVTRRQSKPRQSCEERSTFSQNLSYGWFDPLKKNQDCPLRSCLPLLFSFEKIMGGKRGKQL